MLVDIWRFLHIAYPVLIINSKTIHICRYCDKWPLPNIYSTTNQAIILMDITKLYLSSDNILECNTSCYFALFHMVIHILSVTWFHTIFVKYRVIGQMALQETEFIAECILSSIHCLWIAPIRCFKWVSTPYYNIFANPVVISG